MLGTRGRRMDAMSTNARSTIRLTLPKVISDEAVILRLEESDHEKSWFQYLQERNQTLYQKISTAQFRDRLEVRDNRPVDNGRNHWTLNQKVGEFINAFKRKRTQFTATLRIENSRGGPEAILQPKHKFTRASRPNSERAMRNSGNAGPIPGTSNSNLRKSMLSGTSSKGPQKRKQSLSFQPAGLLNPKEINFGNFEDDHSFDLDDIDIDDDDIDAASVAESIDSQDSQMDLYQRGVANKMIKPRVLELMSRISNANMLRLQAELQDIKRSGKWLNRAAAMPMSCSILQEVFLDDTIV